MTKEEFNAMLAVDGYVCYTLVRIGFASADDTYIARIVQPIQPNDVSEGPYRYEGMARTVLEVSSDVSSEDAVCLLIQLYSEGGHKL